MFPYLIQERPPTDVAAPTEGLGTNLREGRPTVCTSSTHHTTAGIVSEARARLAHVLLGLAGRIHPETGVDYDPEWDAGYRAGFRAGRRETDGPEQ